MASDAIALNRSVEVWRTPWRQMWGRSRYRFDSTGGMGSVVHGDQSSAGVHFTESAHGLWQTGR